MTMTAKDSVCTRKSAHLPTASPQVAALATANEYALRLRDVAYNDKVKELSERAAAQAATARAKLEALRQVGQGGLGWVNSKTSQELLTVASNEVEES
jgi:hypothetical protein